MKTKKRKIYNKTKHVINKTVSILPKETKNKIPNLGVYLDQIRLHGRRVHVRAVPVSGIIASVCPLLITALVVPSSKTPLHTRCSPPPLL